MLLLLPRDPLAPRRVDEHAGPEAAAAELGLPQALVDHGELSRADGDPAQAVRGVPADGDAVHRGRTLRPEQDAATAGAPAAREVTPRTSAEQYRTAHQLPADPDLGLAAAGVAALGLPFVTVDLARRADGVRRAVELGDGQVGDRPTSTPADDLWTVLVGDR